MKPRGATPCSPRPGAWGPTSGPRSSSSCTCPTPARTWQGWLLERAVAGDPVVQVYLDLGATRAHSWDDYETRQELVRLLDEQHPGRPRRPGVPTKLVLKTPEGYVTAWGHTPDPYCAKSFCEPVDWMTTCHRLAAQKVEVTPEFVWTEALWRGLDPPVPAKTADPWGSALQKVKAVPGCAWVPLPPALRKELELELMLKCWVRDMPGLFEDVLRTAARYGHPLYTVYVDLARRQQWDPALVDELVRLDLYHARFRDPPGEVPVLQPMVGPHRVLCSREGFWDGRRWTHCLHEARTFPAWNNDVDEEVDSLQREVAEKTGVVTVLATVEAHPAITPR